MYQIRNSIKYVANKNQKEFIKNLKLVYRANTKENTELKLEELATKWGDK